MRHLLAIADLPRDRIESILRVAERHYDYSSTSAVLHGRTVANLFFEPSTRTRASFEMAGRRLGAAVINVPIEQSSMTKGETDSDTVRTLAAIGADYLVIRHSRTGFPAAAAELAGGAAIINAGDGVSEHPTQALGDALCIRRRFGRLEGLRVAIIGDVVHSRVARSNIALLSTMGAEIRVAGPSHLMDPDMKFERFDDPAAALKGADVIMVLRLQRERWQADHPWDERWQLKAAPAGALVMHPGPINRGVEITDRMVEQSAIWDQVRCGVAARMAVLETLSPAN